MSTTYVPPSGPPRRWARLCKAWSWICRLAQRAVSLARRAWRRHSQSMKASAAYRQAVALAAEAASAFFPSIRTARLVRALVRMHCAAY
jgi:hypothetical protein